MTKWKEVRLGDIANITGGKRLPKGTFVIEQKTNYPYLRITDFDEYGNIDIKNISYITENIYKKIEKYRIFKEDLFISIAGTIGIVGKIPKSLNGCNLTENCAKLQIDSEKITKDFLFYYLKLKPNIKMFKILSSGSSQPKLSLKSLKSFKIKIPDLKTQEKIAKVLSTYDELIENNNRRIELLEQMAEEIYKEWFVRMRFPGHEETKFEKGIPEGWEVKRIGDVINFDIGGGWGKEIYEDNYIEPAYVIRGTDIPDMKYGLFNFENLRYHKENNLEKRKLIDGDIIFEASGGSSNQRLGRTLYITDNILKCYDKEVICASFCKLIRVENYILRWYIKNYLEYAYKTELLSTFEVQSTGISNFGFSNFKKLYSLLIPDKILLEKFYLLTYQMYSKQINLGIQNQNLIKQRDMLLPRLMNGTIEVE